MGVRLSDYWYQGHITDGPSSLSSNHVLALLNIEDLCPLGFPVILPVAHIAEGRSH